MCGHGGTGIRRENGVDTANLKGRDLTGKAESSPSQGVRCPKSCWQKRLGSHHTKTCVSVCLAYTHTHTCTWSFHSYHRVLESKVAGPSWFVSVDEVLAWFDSGQRRMPGFQARLPVGGMQEAAGQ